MSCHFTIRSAWRHTMFASAVSVHHGRRTRFITVIRFCFSLRSPGNLRIDFGMNRRTNPLRPNSHNVVIRKIGGVFESSATAQISRRKNSMNSI